MAGAPLPKLASTTRLLLPVVLLLGATLSGCQVLNKEERAFQGTPEGIHAEANRDLAAGNYAGAIQKLELLEARFPFSDPAKHGQLDLPCGHDENYEVDSAIDQADQFIRENPTHPRVDYAYYIRGLSQFEGGANFMERTFRADLTKRPPQEARKSFQSFQVLVQSYPKSPYAADARQRMVFLRNRLADYELEVARFYMKRGAYVGALNRSRGLVEAYDGAPAVDNALKIAAEAYRRLGMEDLAKVAEEVRAQNQSPDLVNPMAASAGLALSQATGTAKPQEQQTSSRAALRADRWEARVGAAASLSTDVDFEGGTTASIDSGTGFTGGVAYHFNDRLSAGASLTWDSKDYDAVIAGQDPGESFEASGSIDTMSLMIDGAYNFLSGPLTPFVTAGIGWSWVDTNVVNAPPDIVCWWHPWYGYVCTGSSNTKTIDGLAYEVGVGLRWDFSESLAVDGVYRMRWVDYQYATGTPSFDGIQLNIGWKF
jgi:outer membrane protein assembly factor BamD